MCRVRTPRKRPSVTISFGDPMKRFSIACLFFLSGVVLSAQDDGAPQFAPPTNDIVEREGRYYRIIDFPVPDDIVLEVGGILPVPGKRLLVCTRRGEIWWVDGAYEEPANPTFTKFADGMHETLGIAAHPEGGYYVAQRSEVTWVRDTDGDDVADSFETVVKIPVSGSYHEYAFGPKFTEDGNLRITLNVAFNSPTQAPVPWRGWMMEVTPEGGMTPIAAGLRSPTSFLRTSAGDWFFSENQGEWVGSGRITHLEKGDFAGHPASLAWSGMPGSPVDLKMDDIVDFRKPMHEVADELPGLKTPAIWLPHGVLGISSSDIVEDLTGGKFGPFAGQLLIGDQGQSRINRMTLEKVNGVYQGAAYPFRVGFASGIIRMVWGEDGSLFAGSTNRGWGSTGTKTFALARLVWTGETPFEIKEITAEPDGFTVEFTEPVSAETGSDSASYEIVGFTYNYHEAYGSPIAQQLACPVAKVELADDGLSARLAVANLRRFFVHEIKASGVTSGRGDPLLHDTAYYTLNEFPQGERLLDEDTLTHLGHEAMSVDVQAFSSGKRNLTQPTEWGNDAQIVIQLRALPGLKFDRTLLRVKAGQRVQVTLTNPDEMLHNFLLTNPGKGQEIGQMALTMGIDGLARNYVPDSPDVLAHTAILQPDTTETIYFTAPLNPGDYDYICSFPGHAQVMKGILRVDP